MSIQTDLHHTWLSLIYQIELGLGMGLTDETKSSQRLAEVQKMAIEKGDPVYKDAVMKMAWALDFINQGHFESAATTLRLVKEKIER